ncbi:hypothetical protein ACB313_02035 [Klebsiella pneumoniae]
MAMALNMLFGLPLHFGYLIGSVVVIPLVTWGFTFISQFSASSPSFAGWRYSYYPLFSF